ncbi:FtsW/RodA/SpoVE family cell cycle protein [Dysgonomonas sp. 216]|uniref:FtsW/RodA/SpoVE family cell cycle protein n=1 Tax=Dysgonomonas sp. 216 TaxID=2302934 RepID=UPI0013D61B02|nr:FtsW/RodA/SpoVE family cell cycle protein [Dysgonomonas sp. 216]NDW18162.1 FtsW/RodA/SpoVE family cell cycle protein [Dysgonomonas sp. 216]
MESNVITDFFSRIFKGDKTIWGIYIALCAISLLEVFSASSQLIYGKASHWGPVLYHALFIIAGFMAVMILQRVPTRIFSSLILLLPVACILLIFVMIWGEEVNGAQRWASFLGGVKFQPSELAKLAVVGFVAFFLSRTNKENEKAMFYTIIIGTALPCVLIISQNLSTALMIGFIALLMMYLGQISWKRLMAVVLICAALGAAVFGLLQLLPDQMEDNNPLKRFATWKARIERFMEPSADKEEVIITRMSQIPDDERQVIYSKAAIANGGIVSLPGSGSVRDVLPQAFSDFIFAVILEEMGFLGGIAVLLLYVALMIRAGMLARKCKKNFPKYLLLGIALMITIQALINMGVAVSLFPVTGQPLPLISRGGTSILVTSICFGIMLACSNFEEEHENADESVANVQFD